MKQIIKQLVHKVLKRSDNKTLSQWLDLLAKNPAPFNNREAAIHDLNYAKQIVDLLNLNHFSCPVITVGGTNGKGSCVAALESIYAAAGYQVAALTSPHLLRFNERLRINKKEVSDESICQAFYKINQACQQLNLNLSYFRFINLALIWLCQQTPFDVVILEVGLGGRFDSINLIDNDLAIISSVSLDHCHLLGNTREKIAFEKAGIVRAEKFFICGDEEAPQVLLSLKNCDASFIKRDFSYKKNASSWEWQGKLFHYNNLDIPIIHLSNAATVLMAVEKLNARIAVSEADIRQGLQQIKLLGRCQLISHKLTTIVDVAHNVAAVERLLESLKSYSYKKLHVVFAAMSDKDIAGIIALMKPVADHWYLATFNEARAWQISDYQAEFTHAQLFPCIKEAYHAAKEQAEDEDLILAFGSFLVVRDVLQCEKRAK